MGARLSRVSGCLARSRIGALRHDGWQRRSDAAGDRHPTASLTCHTGGACGQDTGASSPQPGHPGGRRLETFDRDAHALVVAIGKEKGALPGDVIDAPAGRCQLRLFGRHGGMQVSANGQRNKFQGPTAPIAYDQPSRLVRYIQWICSSASHAHVRMMTQL
jgi:hypothetical protein